MTTSINPGNIVVPLTAILDQLKGRLSSVELDSLLASIVSRRKSEVHPGDLITSDLINQILQDLEALNEQVAMLSGGTGTGSKNSKATATLHDAWSFYGSLVKSGEFLPDASTADAIKSAAEITAYLQDVMYAALAGGTLGYSGNETSLIDAFQRMYEKQHDVVVLFSAPIPGVSDTTDHRQFSALLNTILELDNAVGDISLFKAVTNKDLNGAIAAQDRINGMVRSQGGDVTTGNLEVIYKGAVGTTETLVIGSAQPVLYRFLVTNRTNRNLDVQLKAEFLPPRQSWTQLSVVGVDGASRSSISLVPFNPSKPTDSAASQEIRVAAMTPAGATNGNTGVLQLTAFVPEPINRKGLASRTLTVATAATNQTPGVVTFSPGSPVVSGSLANATELVTLTLGFEFSFSALQGPSSRNFRFRIDVSSPANPDPLFFTEFAPADAAIDNAASTAKRKNSQAFAMTDGAKRSVTASITPLTGSKGQSMTFTASVESATDGVVVQSQAFTITVTN